jgi:glucose-1-phosphate thymidylyltransferase
MKSVILAGGSGRRLYPLTVSVNKHLLPVHNKPMIYYPLSLLIASGFRDIVLVSGASEIEQFARLLGDGSQWGISIEYAIQQNPHGIAHALRACEPLIRKEPVCVALGDNPLDLIYS